MWDSSEHVCLVWMFQSWLDKNSWIMKPSLWYDLWLCREKVDVGSLENCCTVLFHFSVRWIGHINWAEHHDQNCVSLCILICSPRIFALLSVEQNGLWSPRLFIFSSAILLETHKETWDPPTCQTLIKKFVNLCSLSPVCHCQSRCSETSQIVFLLSDLWHEERPRLSCLILQGWWTFWV